MNEHDNKESDKEYKDLLKKVKNQIEINEKFSIHPVFYHPQLPIHILLAVIYNFLGSAGIIATFHSFYQLVNTDIIAYIIAILFFTVVDTIITILLAHFIFKISRIAFYILLFLLRVLIFLLATLVTYQSFAFLDLQRLFIFTILFQIVIHALKMMYNQVRLKLYLRRNKI